MYSVSTQLLSLQHFIRIYQRIVVHASDTIQVFITTANGHKSV